MTTSVLTTDSTYRTPERPRFFLARALPGFFFYTHVGRIVYQAAGPAKKGLYDDEAWILSSIDAVKSLESVGGGFVLEGLDIVAGLKSPCVFVGNHMSILETFVLPCLVQPHRPVTFVIKESLVNYPFFGHVMRSRRPIIVGRTNPREDLKAVMEEGEARLAAGTSIISFPQTTRSADFDPKKFNSLGIKLAKRCRVPVVPFALLTDAWGLGRRLKDFGRICPEKTVRIRFGEPLSVSGSGKEEHQRIVDFIEDRLAAWRSERCETRPGSR